MAGKEKENKAIEKLKSFFRGSKTTTGNYKSKSDFVLTLEIEKDIGPESPILQRVKAIRDLNEIVSTNRLDDYSVERLWTLVKDLLNKEVETEHRHAAIHFLKCLAQGQYEKLGLMRLYLFQLIRKHDIAQDVSPLFELLQVLTHDGRDIHQLEEELGSFLANWLPAVAGAGRIADYLDLIVNLIKCNAAYIDDVDMFSIVQSACFICCWSQDEAAVENSLKVLGAIVCYSELPGEALKDFAAALCRKVNTNLTLICWKVMRDLLGTHMGHSTLFTLCKFLQDKGSHSDRSLLRGAVFFINMGLWSDKRVLSLKCTPTSVLPSLRQALECGHSLVVYEVMNSVQRLVITRGLELQHPVWDIILDILSSVIEHVQTAGHQTSKDESDDSLTRASIKLNDTLSSIEQLIELGQFNGSVRRVLKLIEMSSHMRPESSVLRLMTYLARSIRPTALEWLTRLDELVERYYKQESRPNIRIKVVDVVSSVVTQYRYIYEEELVERIILPYFTHVEHEPELCVRNAVAQLLLTCALGSDSKKCLEVLNILEKLINRPYEQNITNMISEGDISDIKTVVVGLIEVFYTKIHQTPACHAVRTYKILITHLENHYQNTNTLSFHHGLHYMIFEMLLKLRVNRLGHVGLVEKSGTRYSPYLMVETGTHGAIGSAPPSPAPTPFSLASASTVIVSALRMEKDWRIVNLLLQELPTVMQNKALIADKYGADVGQLADALCSMVSDKSLNLPESLRCVSSKLSRTEFHSWVFPVIAAISAYHTYLEPSQQARCIKCLEFGLASRCASQCVLALTTCTLEMRDAMYKLLPEVLLNLSKISATVVIAIPILEFLSTLTSLPKVFGSFVGDQYMSVFAIALPYTNPFKYNHYTVSLAHHVIAVWFLKCRLPFRRDFVRFITTGLKANAIVTFEEAFIMKTELAALNEDSTSRKRSSSLTEQGSRRRERPLSNARLATTTAPSADMRPPIDDALMNFHVELTETCIDLMARYTFSSCEARPTRSATAEFLLSGGQQQTWLLGHKLITVTTSGCSQKPHKNNLCDRCWTVCRMDRELLSPDGETERDDRATKNLEKTAETAAVESASDGDGSIERLMTGGTGEESKVSRDVCACWCQGWAEIHVRRPTGEMSWVMRLENETPALSGAPDHQPITRLTDLSSLFFATPKDNKPSATEEEPSEEPPAPGILTISTTATAPPPPAPPASLPVSIPGSPASRQSSKESLRHEENSEDKEHLDEDEEEEDEDDPVSGKSRNPVRRSNSSPEMSASWKNPFMKEKGTSHEDSPKARVSCEAIPEEMTPPEPTLHITTMNEIESSLDEHTALPVANFTRDRSRTISVMSPVRKSRYELDLGKPKPHSPRNPKEQPRSGVSPSFVFLQLYHSAHFGAGDEKPILISNNPVIQRAILALDLIPSFETHKVGVLYVGPGQAGNESEMLRNEFGSLRYAMFLQSLGTLINLKHADPQAMFLGGLDKSGVDGKFAYIWQDDVTQVTFHVATLMPNKESDPNCNAKKLHIGNDYVTIVYNESGEEYNFVKLGQFNYAAVVIQPMEMGSNKVTVKVREELAEHINSEHKIVSDRNLPILARQLALHANLASEVCRSLKTKSRDPYASNWLERLRKIKRLRNKLIEQDDPSQAHPHQQQHHHHRVTTRPDPVDDFTEYT